MHKSDNSSCGGGGGAESNLVPAAAAAANQQPFDATPIRERVTEHPLQVQQQQQQHQQLLLQREREHEHSRENSLVITQQQQQQQAEQQLLQEIEESSGPFTTTATATTTSTTERATVTGTFVSRFCYYFAMNSNYASPASSSYSSSPWIRKPLAVVHAQELRGSERHLRNHAATAATAGAHVSAYTSPGHPHGADHLNNHEHHALLRHLTVWDLIAIGVGGTVGSGIFVLTGQIAAQQAGPACFISFIIAGVAACCSGVCYAELSARIPAAGSTYVYAYVCLGEVAAVLAAACLSLEYGIAGAAVARSWGDKVILWLQQEFNLSETASWWLEPFNGLVNIPAFLVSAVSTALLLAGVQESKTVTNVFTVLKLLLVAFMTVGGFCLWRPRQNMLPPGAAFMPFGASGVLRGATRSFFGYLGYDEVCVVAGEAKHPARDMPRAVLGTLLIVMVFYVLAALALTGMVHYTEISPTSGFPGAFYTRHVYWASQVAAIGEVVTLPVVVLISLMAQPRVTLSMADDGLLPAVFAQMDAAGNLYGGTLICGIVMTAIATLVPFAELDDLISAGILVAFSMTNSCLILLRCSPVEIYTKPHLTEHCLIVYHFLCFTTAMLWSHDLTIVPLQKFWAVLSVIGMLLTVYYMAQHCPASHAFGGSILRSQPTSAGSCGAATTLNFQLTGVETMDDAAYFRTPCVPYLPCLGIAVNWYLIAQLEAKGILLLAVYLGMTITVYAYGCAPHSVGHNFQWGGGSGPILGLRQPQQAHAAAAAVRRRRQYEPISGPSDDEDDSDDTGRDYEYSHGGGGGRRRQQGHNNMEGDDGSFTPHSGVSLAPMTIITTTTTAATAAADDLDADNTGLKPPPSQMKRSSSFG